MIYAIIGCLIIIGFLVYKLYQKQKIDKSELEKYNSQLLNIKTEKKLLDEQIDYEKYKLEECRKDLQAALDIYQNITDNKLKEIDIAIEEQRQKRQEELDRTFNEAQEKTTLQLEQYKANCEAQIQQYDQEVQAVAVNNSITIANYVSQLREIRNKYESLLEPIKQYEKEKQERLFYTIQLPEEYQEDIEFLLTTVAEKVQHPDIISKLVWTEYVKPNIEDTFKRIEIKAEPGIYKITNINTGKAYIGKSTNVKTRLADHFKSAVGIKSIADQAIHHAILKDGFWNWMIEVITYCDKEQLSEMEKYYIDFFKTQEFGYNKNAGG